MYNEFFSRLRVVRFYIYLCINHYPMRRTLTLLSAIALLASCSSEPKPEGPEQKPVPPEVMKKESKISIPAEQLASAKDPVCNMSISGGMADTASYEGKLYGFCAEGCKKAFVENPKDFILE